MLLGEHAVLRGEPAVVAAITARWVVRLRVRKDLRIRITSDFGHWEGDRQDLPMEGPLRWVAHAIAAVAGEDRGGFDLQVETAWREPMGLGSSAAVTVAVLGALRRWSGEHDDRARLLEQAVKVIRTVQGVGSGADAAASVYGGVLEFTSEPLRVRPLARELPLLLRYCGYKTPTIDVIRRVQQLATRLPEVMNPLFRLIGELARGGARAIEDKDLPQLGRWMNAAQAAMEALGVSTPELDRMVREFRATEGIWGAKISGAGLGDCAIAVGTTHQEWPDLVKVRVEARGWAIKETR